MRVIKLLCLAVALQSAPCWAEDASTKPEAPQAPVSQEARDPVNPTAAAEPAGGVGSLTPDEQRRAARARARAAAKEAAGSPREAKAPASTDAASRNAVGKAAVKAKVAKPETKAVAERREAAPPVRASEAERRDPKPVRTAVVKVRRSDAPIRQATLSPPERRAVPPVVRHSRQAFVDARSPQVGDVVPSGVPLYSFPPSYNVGPRVVPVGYRYARPWGPWVRPPYPYPPY